MEGVCRSWRRIARRVFFDSPWENSVIEVCHPAQLFTLARRQLFDSPWPSERRRDEAGNAQQKPAGGAPPQPGDDGMAALVEQVNCTRIAFVYLHFLLLLSYASCIDSQ